MFFHEHIPSLMQTYSQFYLMNRQDLIKAQSGTFKQIVLKEGDKSDLNLYLVMKGQVLLKRTIEFEKGVFRSVPFAILQPGHTFNEQAIVAAHHNQQIEEKQAQRFHQSTYNVDLSKDASEKNRHL